MPRRPVGRQQLLESARDELLLREGRLDIAAVVRRAGLTTGALYHHFGSRAGLLAAVYDAFYEELDAAITDPGLPTAPWVVRERERTRRLVRFCFSHPLAPLLFRHAEDDPGIAQTARAYVQRMGEAAAQNIRRGQERGELDGRIDAELAGAYLIGGLRMGVGQLLALQSRPSVEQATERLWRLVAATTGVLQP